MNSTTIQTNDTFFSNDSDSELTDILGPVRDPLTTVIPMTIVYVLILLTGVIGNLCTCIVIANNKYMHTATNYYLFSLAVSDLLLLILGLPQELYLLWQKYPYIFGESVCILRGLTSETSTNASILTITAFTVERYVAICHPLKAHTMSQLPRAIKTILIIWALGAICAIPVAWQFGIIYVVSIQFDPKFNPKINHKSNEFWNYFKAVSKDGRKYPRLGPMHSQESVFWVQFWDNNFGFLHNPHNSYIDFICSDWSSSAPEFTSDQEWFKRIIALWNKQCVRLSPAQLYLQCTAPTERFQAFSHQNVG